MRIRFLGAFKCGVRYLTAFLLCRESYFCLPLLRFLWLWGPGFLGAYMRGCPGRSGGSAFPVGPVGVDRSVGIIPFVGRILIIQLLNQ